jgi:hypothetical protein
MSQSAPTTCPECGVEFNSDKSGFTLSTADANRCKYPKASFCPHLSKELDKIRDSMVDRTSER